MNGDEGVVIDEKQGVVGATGVWTLQAEVVVEWKALAVVAAVFEEGKREGDDASGGGRVWVRTDTLNDGSDCVE